MMNWEQSRQALGGLFGASGPVAAFVVQVLGYPSEQVTVTLNLLGALTPIVWLGVQLYRSRGSGQVRAVAALTADQLAEALAVVLEGTKVKLAEAMMGAVPSAAKAAIATTALPDEIKVLVAKAVPGVATIVVKDDADGVLADLANSRAQPDIVNETENERDAKQGTKVMPWPLARP
jgi:hypothetical protein